MKRRVKKGFRRGEFKRSPRELTSRIAEERRTHPVVVRKLSDEELASLLAARKDRG